MPNDDSEQFPNDELFYESTDSLSRKFEEKHHPDTGERISIVDARVGEAVSRVAAQEAAEGVTRGETEKMPVLSADKFSKS